MADRTHIDEVEQQATLFALGALAAEERDAFARRVAAGCLLCASEIDQCNLTLSLLPLTTPRIPPPSRLRARLLESITQDDQRIPLAEQVTLVRSDEAPWKPSSFPGVEMRFLYKRKTMLVRMAAKSQIPAHPHATAEQCLVLEGSVSSNGTTVNAGDFIYMPAGSMHADLHSREGAVLLVAYA